MESEVESVVCDSSFKVELETNSCNDKTTVKLFTCDICNKSFGRNSRLQVHYSTHNKDSPTSSKVNDTTSLIRSYFQQSSKNHVCPLCSKSFTKSSHLKRHFVTHSAQEQSLVEKSLNSPSNHENFYSGTNGNGFLPDEDDAEGRTCKKCNKTFSQRYHLKRHMLTHKKQGGSVSWEGGLSKDKHNNDFVESNGVSGRDHVCGVCGKGYTRRSHLKRHSYSHTEEKPFICEECGKGFAQKYHLDRHYSTHLKDFAMPKLVKYDEATQINDDGEDSNSSESDNSFPRAIDSSSETYEPVSEDENFDETKEAVEETNDPIQEINEKISVAHNVKSSVSKGNCICTICNLSYSNKSSLCRHNRIIHSKNKLASPLKASIVKSKASTPHLTKRANKFKCSKCDKSFPRKPRLERHLMNFHSTKKSSAIKRHSIAKQSMSPNKINPNRCNVCNKVMANSIALTRHKRHAHREHQVHAVGKRIHKCSLCEKTYGRRTHLMRHFRSSHGSPPSKDTNVKRAAREPSPENETLEQIVAKASTKNLLSRAIILIAQRRSLTCRVCNKTFSRKMLLKEHRLIHESILDKLE